MLVTGIIANSITVAVGEAVKLDSSGFVTNATASTAVLGVCVGFCDASFVPLAPSAYAAGTATSSDVQSVAAASDNQTVALKRALIEASKDKVWSVSVNGTLGTTNSSPTAVGRIGGYVDVDSSGTNYARVLETTFERADGTDQNFFCWGVDAADTTRLLVSIANSVTLASAA